MEPLDLAVFIERYLVNSRLTHSDSIGELLEALSQEVEE